MAQRQNHLSPSEWLSLLAERAPSLRAAGVEQLELEGCKVSFAPFTPVTVGPGPERTAAAADDGDLSDPLNDPATYPGGVVPGFVIERDDGVLTEEERPS